MTWEKLKSCKKRGTHTLLVHELSLHIDRLFTFYTRKHTRPHHEVCLPCLHPLNPLISIYLVCLPVSHSTLLTILCGMAMRKKEIEGKKSCGIFLFKHRKCNVCYFYWVSWLKLLLLAPPLINMYFSCILFFLFLLPHTTGLILLHSSSFF